MRDDLPAGPGDVDWPALGGGGDRSARMADPDTARSGIGLDLAESLGRIDFAAARFKHRSATNGARLDGSAAGNTVHVSANQAKPGSAPGGENFGIASNAVEDRAAGAVAGKDGALDLRDVDVPGRRNYG